MAARLTAEAADSGVDVQELISDDNRLSSCKDHVSEALCVALIVTGVTTPAMIRATHGKPAAQRLSCCSPRRFMCSVTSSASGTAVAIWVMR